MKWYLIISDVYYCNRNIPLGISQNPEQWLKDNGWIENQNEESVNFGLWDKIINGKSWWARIEEVKVLE